MSNPIRSAVPMLALLGLVVACSDRTPTIVEPPVLPPEGPGAEPLHLVAITCRADVKKAEIGCDPAIPVAGDVSADLIVGGQNEFIKLTMTNGAYDAGIEEFGVDVRVRNLIPQALGTTDGVTLDPDGVRVFFQSGPSLTAGTGTVRVNSDGTDMFTSGAQHYYQYNQLIAPFDQSGVRRWSFTMPPSVLSFVFTVYVSAPVRYPDGWVDLDPASYTIRPTAQWKPMAVVRSAVGTAIPDQSITWSTADSTLATVTDDGVVTGVRAGAVLISAVSGSRSGSASFTVTGIQRHWTGAVDSDWHTGGNWSLNGVVPGTADTVVVPSGLATPYPVLTENTLAGDIVVENTATISVAGFDLTTVGNLATGTSGGITGTGRLFLAGFAKNVQGILPRVRVPGTYSLTGNIITRAPLQVDLGRLTNWTFRIQTTSY